MGMAAIRIRTTTSFDRWFVALDDDTKGRVQDRVLRVQKGNFGDYKPLGDGVWELRCYFGGGIRIYYTYDGENVVLLLAGGNKATQKWDIKKAKAIARQGGD